MLNCHHNYHFECVLQIPVRRSTIMHQIFSILFDVYLVYTFMLFKTMLERMCRHYSCFHFVDYFLRLDFQQWSQKVRIFLRLKNFNGLLGSRKGLRVARGQIPRSSPVGLKAARSSDCPGEELGGILQLRGVIWGLSEEEVLEDENGVLGWVAMGLATVEFEFKELRRRENI